MKLYCYLILGIWGFYQTGYAQKKFKPYTDHRPSYKEWQRRYILDKISYTAERTIFHFRYAGSLYGSHISLYGPGQRESWALVNVDNPEESYELIELLNIRRDDVVVCERFDKYGRSISYDVKEHEFYTMEVHFPRLPNHIKVVDFLEGKTLRRLTNHFHCFSVKLKTWDDPSLGTPEDSQARIADFNAKMNAPLQRPSSRPAPPNPPTVRPPSTSRPTTALRPRPRPQDREAKAQEGED